MRSNPRHFTRPALSGGLVIGLLDALRVGTYLAQAEEGELTALSGVDMLVLSTTPVVFGAITGALFGILGWMLWKLEAAARSTGPWFQRRPFWAMTMLLSPLLALVAYYIVARPSLMRRWGDGMVVAAIPLTLLGILMLPSLLKRAAAAANEGPAPLHRALWLVGGLALFVVDSFTFRGRYEGFHALAALGALGAFSWALREPARPTHRFLESPWLIGATFALTLWVVDAAVSRSFQSRLIALSQTSGQSKVLAALQATRRSLNSAPPRSLPAAATAPGEARDLRAQLGLSADATSPHIFLITFDAVRAQSLRLFAPEAPTGRIVSTPVLEGLANNGVLYTRAYTPSAQTVGTFGTWVRAGRAVEQTSKTLYTQLRDGGYQTFCNVPWSFLRTTIAHDHRPCDHELWTTELATLTEAFRTSLGQMTPKRPLFAHLHVFETHDRNPDVATAYGTGHEANYLADIARSDREMGRWLEIARDRGFLDNAIVIVTSDHGESLGERGVDGHGSKLYDEQTWVPLVVWASTSRPQRNPAPVSVGWLGQSIVALSGAVQASALTGPYFNSDAPVLMRQGTLHAIVEGNHKLIYDSRKGTTELYDVVSNPGETVNLADTDAPLRKRLVRRLENALGVSIR